LQALAVLVLLKGAELDASRSDKKIMVVGREAVCCASYFFSFRKEDILIKCWGRVLWFL
jgi:hypothetical protein